MPPSQTYYDVLDVPANAPAEHIKESYHVIVSIWHPDRFPQDSKQHQLATRKVRELNAAYEVLRDPARRAAYDRRLVEAVSPAAPARRLHQLKMRSGSMKTT